MNKIKRKKKLMVTIIAAFALSIAFAAVALATPSTIQKPKADEPVNTEAHVTETVATILASDAVNPDASLISIQLEDENGTIIYEAEFSLDNVIFEVKVDATTGVVLSVDKGNDSEELDEADDDDIEFEDENDNDDSLEADELENDENDDYGIDWEEEGENDTEN